MNARVHVRRNWYGLAEHPWLVTCGICAGEPEIGFSDMLAALVGGAGMKGWAPTWRIAQDYAHRHALEHEKTRCPSCLHVPASPLPEEASR